MSLVSLQGGLSRSAVSWMLRPNQSYYQQASSWIAMTATARRSNHPPARLARWTVATESSRQPCTALSSHGGNPFRMMEANHHHHIMAPFSSMTLVWQEMGLWFSSTLKKRRAKMNKHKLQKRRKKLRLKTK